MTDRPSTTPFARPTLSVDDGAATISSRAEQPPPDQILSVTELNRIARQTLERAIPLLRVSGEISNLVRAASGHLYFTLKDANAQVRCAMWRNRSQLLAFRPENGMRVELRAIVTLYEARGDYQLNVESIGRAGQGNLFEAFLQLKSKLADEGLFDAALKREPPRFPRRIGVVTSTAAAALRDVIACLARRAPQVDVIIYPAAVQGAGAGTELTEAVLCASRRAAEDEVDVLLLVRGGGSLEDLYAFNDEALARAIRACTVPVIAGIGHETDFTIADFVADLRAATPTMAAEMASAGHQAVRQRLPELAHRLKRSMLRRQANAEQQLDRSALRLVHPRDRLRRASGEIEALAQRLERAGRLSAERGATRLQASETRLRLGRPCLDAQSTRLDTLGHRLVRGMAQRLANHASALSRLESHLSHLSPLAVLQRGYSITHDDAGRIVRSHQDLAVGNAVSVQLADGSVEAAVTATYPGRKPEDTGPR